MRKPKSRFTPPQRHALMLLAIQEQESGWALKGTLTVLGTAKATLDRLIDMGLVEMRENDTVRGDYYRYSYRLTPEGKPVAASLRQAANTVTLQPQTTI